MKPKLLLLITAAISIGVLSGCAEMQLQPASEADRNIELIVEAPGHSKSEIYDLTRVWLAENFRSAKAVIEYEDKENGVIIGNGSINYPCNGFSCVAKADWTVSFTMRVDMKDERFKMSFSNLELSWPPSRTSPAYRGPIYSKGDIETVKPQLLAFGEQLKGSFEKTKSKSNW